MNDAGFTTAVSHRHSNRRHRGGGGSLTRGSCRGKHESEYLISSDARRDLSGTPRHNRLGRRKVPRNQFQEIRRGNGLGQHLEVLLLVRSRFQKFAHAVVPGKEQGAGARVLRLHLHGQVDAVHPRQPHIDDHQMRIPRGNHRQRLFGRIGCLRGVTNVGKNGLQRVGDVVLIVDDQNLFSGPMTPSSEQIGGSTTPAPTGYAGVKTGPPQVRCSTSQAIDSTRRRKVTTPGMDWRRWRVLDAGSGLPFAPSCLSLRAALRSQVPATSHQLPATSFVINSLPHSPQTNT